METTALLQLSIAFYVQNWRKKKNFLAIDKALIARSKSYKMFTVNYFLKNSFPVM